MDITDNYPTVPPPPNGPLFTIQLFYPNDISLGRKIAEHLKSHIHVEDGMLHTLELEQLTNGMHNLHTNLVIVGIDEFCNLEEVFQTVRQLLQKTIPIIAHLAAPIEMDQSVLIDYSVIGTFVQYDFIALTSLVSAVINNSLTSSEEEIILDAD